MHAYCPAFMSIAIRSKPNDEQKILLSRTRCKSWACPFCANQNKARWQAFLLYTLPAISQTWSFHTITLPSSVRGNANYSPEDRTLASLARIRANWEKLIKRMKRYLGKFQYFRVFERHADGALHIHMLIDMWIAPSQLRKVENEKQRYIYWKWLKEEAPQCGFGYMTSSENLLDEKRGVAYTTKYMVKEDLEYSKMLTKYHIRRFQASQGIGSQEDWGRDNEAWYIRSFVDAPMLRAASYYDCNISQDINPIMVDDMGVYPPLEQYAQSELEQKRRKELLY